MNTLSLGKAILEVMIMPRNDGNKDKNEDLKKIELTLRNIHKNEEFLAENAGELTPHQIKDVKAHLASKKKHLEETDGTIK